MRVFLIHFRGEPPILARNAFGLIIKTDQPPRSIAVEAEKRRIYRELMGGDRNYGLPGFTRITSANAETLSYALRAEISGKK